MEKNSQPVFVPLTNDLPALLSTSAVVSPLEGGTPTAPLESSEARTRPLQVPKGRVQLPGIDSPPSSLGFHTAASPSCRFGGEAQVAVRRSLAD